MKFPNLASTLRPPIPGYEDYNAVFSSPTPTLKLPTPSRKDWTTWQSGLLLLICPGTFLLVKNLFFGYQRVVQVKDCRRIWCIFVVQWLPSAFKPDYLPHHLPNITGVWKEKKLGVVHVMGGIIHWLLMADCVPCLIRQKLGAMAGLKTPATNLDAFSKVNCQTVNFDIF